MKIYIKNLSFLLATSIVVIKTSCAATETIDSRASLALPEQTVLKPFMREIREIKNMPDALNHSFTLDDLVVFDVDDTLVINCNPYDIARRSGTNSHFDENKKEISLLFEKNESIRNLYEKELLLWKKIDEALDALQELRKKGVKVIALTSLKPTIREEIGIDIPKQRIEMLEKCGFDSPNSTDHIPRFTASASNGPDFGYIDSTDTDVHSYFRKWVIFSGEISIISTSEGEAKGKALRAYLNAVSFKPKNIIFIDNRREYVDHVNDELTRLEINGYSVHYTKMEGANPEDFFSEEERNNMFQKQKEFIDGHIRHVR